MDLQEFEKKIAVNGVDIEKWIDADRAAAEKLLGSSVEAQDLLVEELNLDGLLDKVSPEIMSNNLEANILASVDTDNVRQVGNVVRLDRRQQDPVFVGWSKFGGLMAAASLVLMILVSLPNDENVSDVAGGKYASYDVGEEQIDAEIDDFLYDLLEESDEDIDELLEML